jgi:hypothetical protein
MSGGPLHFTQGHPNIEVIMNENVKIQRESVMKVTRTPTRPKNEQHHVITCILRRENPNKLS